MHGQTTLKFCISSYLYFLERKGEDRRRGLKGVRQSLSLMHPKVLSDRLRPSVLNPGTSWKGTLAHRREVKPVPPSTCRIHTQLLFINCLHILRFISKSGGWLGSSPRINQAISPPLTISTHIFIIPALVVWRHSTHPSLAIFAICQETERDRGFQVIFLTLLSSFFTLSSLRHCSERPCLKLLTALSLRMTNTSVTRRQTRKQTSSFAATSAAASRTDTDHVRQQKIPDIEYFCFSWLAYRDNPVDRKWKFWSCIDNVEAV